MSEPRVVVTCFVTFECLMDLEDVAWLIVNELGVVFDLYLLLQHHYAVEEML